MTKRQLSIWQMITMSFGFLGIQAGFALQNGNTSRILRSFGADVHDLPLFWLVAPLIGMIVQPIIGYYSDRTWNSFGRRKPFFLAGAILSSLALVLIPNSALFVSAVSALWVAAGFVMMMDASFNVAMEPFRALVADILPNKQRTVGFCIQTCLIGIGAFIGSKLPSFLADRGYSLEGGVSGVAPNITWAFYFGAAIFMISILITVFFTKEYPPTAEEKAHLASEKKLNFLDNILADIKTMPVTMKQLGFTQFFSWFALFSMWVFTTDAVASHVVGLTGDYAKSVEYNMAGNVVGDAFGTYNIVSAIYALLLPFIAGWLGRKQTHAVSLLAGGIGLISIYFLKDIQNLHYSMIGVGIAWASILSMPYAILSSSVPTQKMGIYMGIFNFFITLPQIASGIFNKPLLQHVYGGQAIMPIVMAGVFMIAGAVSVLFVKEAEN